ncbi:MAG: hypothetical protein ABTQ34_08220 [Bdellovibrionales bacterium]
MAADVSTQKSPPTDPQAQIAELNRRLEDMQKNAAKREAENAALKNANGDLESKLKVAEAEKLDFLSQIKKLAEELDDLKNKKIPALKDHKDENDQLKGENAVLKTTVKGLEQAFINEKIASGMAQSEISHAHQQRDDAVQFAIDYKKANDDLFRQLNDLKARQTPNPVNLSKGTPSTFGKIAKELKPLGVGLAAGVAALLVCTKAVPIYKQFFPEPFGLIANILPDVLKNQSYDQSTLNGVGLVVFAPLFAITAGHITHYLQKKQYGKTVKHFAWATVISLHLLALFAANNFIPPGVAASQTSRTMSQVMPSAKNETVAPATPQQPAADPKTTFPKVGAVCTLRKGFPATSDGKDNVEIASGTKVKYVGNTVYEGYAYPKFETKIAGKVFQGNAHLKSLDCD